MWFSLTNPIIATLSLAPLANVHAAETARPPYNVLFIAIDDLNDWAGAFGGISHYLYAGEQQEHPMTEFATDEAMIREMIGILRESMEKSHAAGDTRRGAHAKSHGLLKAQFVVLDSIPNELKVGIFREPKSYAALIRLSNASASIKSDKQKDFRGFAIKLLGVPGERVNQDEKQTQDFVLMSSPTMPPGTQCLRRLRAT